jgi:hypothetical protein
VPQIETHGPFKDVFQIPKCHGKFQRFCTIFLQIRLCGCPKSVLLQKKFFLELNQLLSSRIPYEILIRLILHIHDIVGTRFKARNCISEPGNQEPYGHGIMGSVLWGSVVYFSSARLIARWTWVQNTNRLHSKCP